MQKPVDNPLNVAQQMLPMVVGYELPEPFDPRPVHPYR